MSGDVLLTQLRSVARRIAATPAQAEDASIVQQAADRLERFGSEPAVPLSEVKEALLGEEAVEELAKEDYRALAHVPFGCWEAMPEKYKGKFRELASQKLVGVAHAAGFLPLTAPAHTEEKGEGRG